MLLNSLKPQHLPELSGICSHQIKDFGQLCGI